MLVKSPANERKKLSEFLLNKFKKTYGQYYVKLGELNNSKNHALSLNCLYITGSGIVVLIDRTYPKDSLPELHQKLKDSNRFSNIAYVFIPDDKYFFRQTYGLRQYEKNKSALRNRLTKNELSRLISLRHEEEFVYSINKWLQYYQNASSDLEESIVSYKLQIIPTVNGIDFDDTFNESRLNEVKKLRLWVKKLTSLEKLALVDNCIL